MRSARLKLPGHPDKACDLVAEAIVDEYLRRDPETRLKVHVAGGHGALFVSGEVSGKADFDVAALVRRVVGKLGALAELEPFVSLEPMRPEQIPFALAGSSSPIEAFGYATAEQIDAVPETVSLARRLGKALEDYRTNREDAFWLGPDAEVMVIADRVRPTTVSLTVEHGTKNILEVRRLLANLVHESATDVAVRVNDPGPNESRGLAHAVGASGKDSSPYGSLLPSMSAGIGVDPHHPEKAGAWLVRAAARSLIRRGAKAAFVQALYFPGEPLPAHVSIRDELGKDRSAEIEKRTLSLDRVMGEWWRNDLCSDAARWGFAGEPDLPWEV